MINKVVLMGRLVATPELKYTQTNKSVCPFTLAVERRMSQDKVTDFIDCVAWNKTAEFINRWFNKGSMLALVGRVQCRTYTTQDGHNRKMVEVIVDEVSFCGRESSNNTPASNTQTQQGAPVDVDPEGFVDLDDDDDNLPF